MAAKKAAKKKATKKKAAKKVAGRAALRLRTADVTLRVRSRSEAGDEIVAKIEALATPKAAKSRSRKD